MPHSENDVASKLDRLLRESAELREKSEVLAREAARLKATPRLKGK